MELIDILLIALLIIASILGLYFIKLVQRLFTTIDMVENKIEELDNKLIPLINDLQEMVDSGNYVVNVVKEQAESIEKIRDTIKNKLGIIASGQDKEASPQASAMNLVTNLRAIVKGASTFINELKNK
jgi:uncharacterized protein YoxC